MSNVDLCTMVHCMYNVHELTKNEKKIRQTVYWTHLAIR